ncbi:MULTISPECIES: PadR family transcriptional regulator [Mesorhizobium]|jgi:DNA-binding PadR family transcriptional regulator|uniref:Transcriptional regulator n=1 Tax=Mesorhizobium opportunistum (strain LMG 24607 / HAMBI 3007 / WSM2075) TaxID=536019 RepID=F7Y4I8_MESOW|nr:MULTISPECIES: PadR family transcriptional regulator [Mesorhizobium]AEH87308.1 putative transcriptional regulator [Mesorhizobium opportunistum WSM2075]MCA0030412.1 PadR family transcriptional regulator [Mesorhizobium sp. B263B2A]TPN50327.1 PadR family transcriptional regulator [Mesorhizobium sp. B1-1-9]TPN53157.1 PadR family transcriptional regulator [Mesorhizobium sp. B1-1-7]
MNVIRLLVYGAIRELGAAHGYAVRRQLDNWHVETWAKVRSGSVYHAIGQLQKEGKLVERGREDGERGADRTAFALTHDGEAEFFGLLEEALGSFELTHLSAGIAFLDLLAPERARMLLVALHDRLTANRDHLTRLAAATTRQKTAPRTSDLLELWIGYLEVTARAVDQLSADFASDGTAETKAHAGGQAK